MMAVSLMTDAIMEMANIQMTRVRCGDNHARKISHYLVLKCIEITYNCINSYLMILKPKSLIEIFELLLP